MNKNFEFLKKWKRTAHNLFWNSNFLTFLGILVGIATYIYTIDSENSTKKSAFRKKVIIATNNLYSNVNELQYIRNQFDSNKVNSLNPAEISYLKTNINKAQQNLVNIKYLLNSDVYINQISDNYLFDILSLINSSELNLTAFQAFPENDFPRQKLNHFNYVISFEFYLASALRKAYKINTQQKYLENFQYFNETMRDAFLLKHDDIELNRTYKSGEKINLLEK